MTAHTSPFGGGGGCVSQCLDGWFHRQGPCCTTGRVSPAARASPPSAHPIQRLCRCHTPQPLRPPGVPPPPPPPSAITACDPPCHSPQSAPPLPRRTAAPLPHPLAHSAVPQGRWHPLKRALQTGQESGASGPAAGPRRRGRRTGARPLPPPPPHCCTPALRMARGPLPPGSVSVECVPPPPPAAGTPPCPPPPPSAPRPPPTTNLRACECSGHGLCSSLDGACTCYSDETRGFWTGRRCDACAAAYLWPGCTDTNVAVTRADDLPIQHFGDLGSTAMVTVCGCRMGQG